MKVCELFEDAVSIKIDKPDPKVGDWIKKIYSKFPVNPMNNRQRCMVWGKGEDQTLAIFELSPSNSKKNAVELYWFQAYPLRKGVGSKAMKELQRLATEDSITLTLFPWDKGKLSQAALIKFYKRLGFVPIRKGGKDMEWVPREVADES